MRVFIHCPTIATGGTELIHQFARCLMERNVETYVVYMNAESTSTPTPDSFAKYGVKYVAAYVDAKDSVLVLAETQVHLLSLCKLGKVVVWWMSVDNYLVYGRSFKGTNVDYFGLRQRKDVLHLCQSEYSKRFIEKEFGITNAVFLKDYINDDIVNFAKIYADKMKRRNIILYNPRKGYNNIEPIIKACRKDIIWKPLQGMKPHEMAALMCMAKVYIDFGHHPGKDRIPREAAACGCCIITNRIGSAAFKEDVFIPDKWKVEDMSDVEGTLQRIYELVDNYDICKTDYEEYQQRILGEKEEFFSDIDKFVLSISQLKENIVQSVNSNLLIYDTMQEIVDEMKRLLENACQSEESGEVNEMINSLLDADYCINIFRESLYAKMRNYIKNESRLTKK